MLPRTTRTLLPLIVLLLVGTWIFWLRWPTFGWKVWNLDEGIYSTIGRVILEGGVMYRDGIDNRTPLTHYLSAGIYGIVGVNNQWGAHFVLAGLITSVAMAVFLIGRRWYGTGGAIFGAFAFATISSVLLFAGDAYSLGCEWFIIFFSSWSAWWFLRSLERNSFWSPFFAGAGYAAAFLAKQPGLLDFGAPLAVAVFLCVTRQWRPGEAARVIAGLVSGFTAAIAAVFAYFWINGALHDFYLYAWVFNMVYYTTETSLLDRLVAASALFTSLWDVFPVLLLALLACVLVHTRLLLQKRPTDAEKADGVRAFFLLAWLLTSTGGAAAAGRVYGHYYIQMLPAVALTVGWSAAVAIGAFQSPSRWLRALGVVVLAALAWNLTFATAQRRHAGTGHDDAGRFVGDYIKSHSLPTDKIFVWGFNPDLYLFAERAPASRFIYCGFQTGLIPWTNAEPHIDTSYAIIPGSMETLLADLERERPEFFVDGSPGAWRLFAKYPLEKFPPLAAFVTEHYVEIEPSRFALQQFRLLRLKDSSRRKPIELAGGTGGELTPPTVRSPAIVDTSRATFVVEAAHSTGRLQRIELVVGGKAIERVSFPPAAAVRAAFVIEADKFGTGHHNLFARATSSSGETVDGPVATVQISPDSLPASVRAGFTLPVASTALVPERISGPFGARSERVGEQFVFSAHAPAVISYRLAPRGAEFSGRFGIDPAAYAPGKPDPTDGADFIVIWIPERGRPQELFRRFLDPRGEAADRGAQSFLCRLPDGETEGTLELRIAPGPLTNATSDWTYWANLHVTKM